MPEQSCIYDLNVVFYNLFKIRIINEFLEFSRVWLNYQSSQQCKKSRRFSYYFHGRVFRNGSPNGYKTGVIVAGT